MTKEQAMIFLRDRGFHAVEREGVAGEMILVAQTSGQDTSLDVAYYPAAVCIVRCGEGWIAERAIVGFPDGIDRALSLEEACGRAMSILSESEAGS